MCGIIGQIAFDDGELSTPRLNLLQHRGPDGSGEWTNNQKNVYFGHARLAIIDPSPTGDQPMSDSSGRFTITFNGEIYNHLELRSALPDMRWRGSCDTETLIELLAAEGLQTLNLLKGMFAFALYDNVDDSVLLVRDRLGIKPLWIKSEEKKLIFASEIRPLIQSADFVPNSYGLSEYLAFGRLPSTGNIFNGIESIPPGSWLKISAKGEISRNFWWRPQSFTAAKFQNRQSAAKRVKQLVTTAIEEHLISDVGMGAFLSGGIDSSIVTLVAGKALGRNLQTFTVGFPQGKKNLDERSIARKVAEKAGTEHRELELNEDSCLDWVKDAVLKLDLPSVDAINTFIVSKAVRETGLKVALSGLGGDELFGGYPSFKDVPRVSWLGSLPINLRRRIISLFPQNLREKLEGLNDFSIAQLTAARRRFASSKDLTAMGLENGVPVFAPPFPANLDTMGIISWAEIQEYMIPMLLRDSDQMSMAVGLELRVPFLDHRLVEEVLSIPQNFKKGEGVKPLLVEAFREELPTEVYKRKKQGFELPMDEWIRGPLLDFTKDGLSAAADLLGLNEPLRQWDDFNKGGIHWTRIWKWSVLGHWLATQKASTDCNLLQNHKGSSKNLQTEFISKSFSQ